eukprot:CAMPEP_0178401098 /NCGR_PEP_ID=MMETSP0689_2-20121128/16128_1 /TAXON_ID=160604 /ORGANISM="Amphidinium massartii, Strain CS-259" /LENGTH=1272 /DNA_ID=CAMNT_0020021911 /DNA_START=11 /DNA_END=3829 /DNA_ORIENTATION=-
MAHSHQPFHVVTTNSMLHWGLLRFLLAAAVLQVSEAAALPRLRLQPRPDGSMQLVAEHEGRNDECSAVFAPRGVSLAVKGPPWVPITDKFDPNISLNDYDFGLLASAGVNVIRLGVMMPGVLPDAPVDGEYHRNQEYIDHILSIVETAASYGMYTLVDFHQDVISEYFCGEGIPRWVAEEIDAAFNDEFEEEVMQLLSKLHLDLGPVGDQVRSLVRKNIHKAQFPAPLYDPYQRLKTSETGSRTYSSLYRREDCARGTWYQYQFSFAAGHAYKRIFDLESSTFQHMKAYWTILSQEFQNNTNILAFDLFNEPFPGSPLTEPWMIMPGETVARLSAFYEAIAQVVHEIDPNRLVTFSPVTWEEGGYYLRKVNSPAEIMCHFFEHLLDKINFPVQACETVWSFTPLLPESGTKSTAFTRAPLPNQSILSFHFYTPPELNSEVYAQKRLEDAKRLQVYPLLSETCCLSTPNSLQHLWWFEKAQIGWLVWEYKVQADGHGYGALITGVGPDMFNGDEPIKERWRRLAHPSAQDIRGQVVANIFDFTYGTFNLTFVPTSEACGGVEHDALIKWPFTWWMYINISESPIIHVHPPGSADVLQVACPFGYETIGMLCYGVDAVWRNASEITVTLAFEGFKCVDLLEQPKEPELSAPWWGGLGWPVLGLLSLLCFSWCCLRCGAFLQSSKGKAAVHSCIAQSSCELEEGNPCGGEGPPNPRIPVSVVRAQSGEERVPLIHAAHNGNIPPELPVNPSRLPSMDVRQEEVVPVLDEPAPAAPLMVHNLMDHSSEPHADVVSAADLATREKAPDTSAADESLLIELDIAQHEEAHRPFPVGVAEPVEASTAASLTLAADVLQGPSREEVSSSESLPPATCEMAGPRVSSSQSLPPLLSVMTGPKARSQAPVPPLSLPEFGQPWQPPAKESGAGHCPSIEGVPGLSQAAASRGDTAIAASSLEPPEGVLDDPKEEFLKAGGTPDNGPVGDEAARQAAPPEEVDAGTSESKEDKVLEAPVEGAPERTIEEVGAEGEEFPGDAQQKGVQSLASAVAEPGEVLLQADIPEAAALPSDSIPDAPLPDQADIPAAVQLEASEGEAAAAAAASQAQEAPLPEEAAPEVPPQAAAAELEAPEPAASEAETGQDESEAQEVADADAPPEEAAAHPAAAAAAEAGSPQAEAPAAALAEEAVPGAPPVASVERRGEELTSPEAPEITTEARAEEEEEEEEKEEKGTGSVGSEHGREDPQAVAAESSDLHGDGSQSTAGALVQTTNVEASEEDGI